MPRRATHRADEQVCRRCRQTVEHGVLRRADGAAHPRLGGRCVAEFHEGAGDFHQAMRVHGASPPGAGQVGAFAESYYRRRCREQRRAGRLASTLRSARNTSFEAKLGGPTASICAKLRCKASPAESAGMT